MSELGKIAAAMGGEVTGNRAIFPTPGHSAKDRGSWASIVPGAPDGVLIHSQNGGDPLAIKDELRAKGVLPRFEPQGDSWRVTGTYDYADADGTILYRTVRKEKAGERKRFVAERVQGRGWANGLGDMDRVLYRLPDIAADPAKPVYLVEGERKADKLASWGFTATAVAFGAKGWRKGYTDALAGRTVIILPDNDEPGRDFAERARRDIAAAGGKAIVLDLPGLPPKGDIIDWNGTADDLRALANKAINPPVQLHPALDLAALAHVKPVAKRFAIERLAPLAEVTLFTGPGSAGKSLLGQQLATAAAAGLPCLGLAVMAGPAIYLTCEDDAEQLHWRQAHICDAMGVPMATLAGKLHLISLRGELDNALTVETPERGKSSPSPSYTRLVQTIAASGSKLVILDNVAHLFTGNENDRGDVTRFVNLLNRLAGETGAAILLLGHPPKPGKPTDVPHDYSGSTAWLNAVRSQFKIDHARDGEGNVPDQDARVLTVGKANYAQKGEALRFRWHNWAFVREDDLPKDQRAELSAVIKANGEDAAFMRCLAAATTNKRAVSHNPGVNYAPTVFAKMAEGKGLGKNAFERAFERLLHVGKIELDAALWQDTHRHWKQGIKAVEKCGDPTAATPCGDLRAPPSQPIENACGDLRAATPLYTTYNNGAAHGSAAPYHEDDLDWGTDEGADQ
ncbi:AAA family ATPase [Sphingomonas sp. HH69]